MIPPLIVQQAIANGINLIAITDHNSTANALAVIKAAQGSNVHVLPGMELQTREEVHILCLFDNIESAEKWHSLVAETLPPIKNNPDFFGEQFVVDETGDYIRSETQLLAASSSLTLKEAAELVASLGGLFIPSHIDRQAYGLLPVLGLLPQDVHFDAMEISRHTTPEEICTRYPPVKGMPLIQGGDAHYLHEIVGANEFHIQNPTIGELRMAFNKQGGREIHVIQP